MITCTVKNTVDEKTAETLAKSVIGSSLTKAAVFGCDANWGRVLCALGYSGIAFDQDKVDISFHSKAGSIAVAKNGKGLAFDEDIALAILKEDEVVIVCDMHI